MHHESTRDTDVILISDSEVEIIDLTTDDVVIVNPEEPNLKHRDCERVVGDEGIGVRRPSDGGLAACPGGVNGMDKMGLYGYASDSLSPKRQDHNDINIISSCSSCSSGLPEFIEETNKPTKLKKSKQRKPVVNWTSSDDSDSEFEFEEKFSLPKQNLRKVRRVLNHRRGTPKKPAMLSLSKPVSHFPVSLFNQDMKPKLTNLHLKHGWTSESEPSSPSSPESDSDLLNPCSFLLSRQQVRAASPILVDLYPSIAVKGCKREVAPSSPARPLKKSRMVQHGVITRESGTDKMKISTSPQQDKLLKNLSKPLLTLSDFSNSEDEFEPCTKRVMHTPSKQSWLNGTSPHKTSQPGLPRPFKKEDRLVGTPIHISVKDVKRGAGRDVSVAGNGKNKLRNTRANSTVILDFCQRQRDMIEAVVDESFIDDSIVLIRDFATLHRGAPKEYMMYLLKDVLLADGTEDNTVLSAYEALMHIHGLHPTAATSLTIDWDLVTTIVKKLNLETKSDSAETPRLAHVLALQFVVVVLVDDFKTARRKEKSCLYALLSVDMCLANVRTLIQWICGTITKKLIQSPAKPETEQKPEQETPTEDRNVWQFLQQFTKETPETIPCKSKETRPQYPLSEGYLSVLHLLQKLLLLSFATGKSDSALKIAEEFLYPYLYIPSLQLRKICLQTMTCDQVRSKVIELLLENLCELNSSEQQGVLSVPKIVTCLFKSRPMRVGEFVLAERDVNATEKRRVRSPSDGMREIKGEECEELAMLLFSLLQSYIRNKKAHALQTVSHDAQPSYSPDEFSPNSLPSKPSHPAAETGLSMEDRECLLQMGDHAEALETRLRSHCEKLTMRTRLYLAQIESMRELA
ncbi:uncharacterized protein LOC119739859 [Patiria miniata]|uniref:Uncharacterized protein n=1 Tax=Patiria miniata TaxID=46514 RepID=A0A914B3L1_PATMI|nr:uncharacterized protein LOC119739859 [Patiria miniata]